MTTSWKVTYYTSKDGKNPVRDFLDECNKKQQSKLLRIISNINQYGLLSVVPHLKKLEGFPFWEIKILGRDNIRVIYTVMIGQEVLLLHGFFKKSQKTPLSEISISMKRYKEWIDN
ncbi:MAG: type II toxin-antitoxin system RelE/ParE family toxin [Patescibacteria group bacterium]